MWLLYIKEYFILQDKRTKKKTNNMKLPRILQAHFMWYNAPYKNEQFLKQDAMYE